ncbi:Cytochrome P450 2C38 like protein [Argiope bruennichi]|uniref:Cytochrome P450 2C38 like protein n=1 Tax=Argiope bruennichi TaxID=94029 RepID=A0A8T0FBE0_ARGBR|nr:Cytochrome P450 2C38 like protein [Argiope bruennichi]
MGALREKEEDSLTLMILDCHLKVRGRQEAYNLRRTVGKLTAVSTRLLEKDHGAGRVSVRTAADFNSCFVSDLVGSGLVEEEQQVAPRPMGFRTAGGRLITILNGHKVIKEVLLNRGEEFIGRPHGMNIVSWISDGIGISQEEAQPWSEQRKFFMQTAKNFGLGKQEFEFQIQDEIKILLQELRNLDGKPNDLCFHLAYTFNSIISKVLFNRKFDKDVTFKRNLNSMNEMVHLFTGAFHLLIGIPFHLFLYIFGNKEMVKGKKDILKFVGRVVDEIKQSYDPSHPKCYVEAYLQQQEELKKKGRLQESSFTEHRLKANAYNLFFEGTESVTSTIGSLLVELSKHPDVQRKVQEELDSVVGRERLPSWTDKQNLPYMDATIQELYRKAALFLVLTMYSNFKETTIEGYRIPKRSIVIANLYSIHFDPKLFPNPDKFDPGRFLNSEGKRIKVEGGPYLFGLGKRACIGEILAQVEIFLLIGSLLQSFSLPYAKDMDSLRVVPRE